MRGFSAVGGPPACCGRPCGPVRCATLSGVRACPVCEPSLLVWAARGLPPETSRCPDTLRGPRRAVCVGGLWTPGAVLPLSCIPKVAGVGDTWCPAEGGGQGGGTHPRVQLRTPPGSDVLSPALPSGGFRAFSLLAARWRWPQCLTLLLVLFHCQTLRGLRKAEIRLTTPTNGPL